MTAIPKEIVSGEKLIAKIVTEDYTYENEADENNTAVFEIEMTDSIEAIFIIKSETSLKQEKLEKIYTSSMLSKTIYGDWESSTNEREVLQVWITDDSDIPFLNKEDVEKAEFILSCTETDMGVNAFGASSHSTAVGEAYDNEMVKKLFENLDGILIDAVDIEADEGFSKYDSKYVMGYSVDLSEYANKKDGNIYEIYFVLTAKDGRKYATPYGPIGTFRTLEGGRSRSIGDGILVAII